MDVRLLGGVVEYRGPSGPVPVPGTTARAVLAMLALSPCQVVLGDEITEGLWGRRFPHDPTAAVQVTVSRLRRVLGEDRHRLRTVHLGYVLDATREEIDVTRAEDALREGLRLLADKDTAAAETVLSSGLNEWRHDTPLVEFADLPFGPSASSRLLTLRCELVQACNQAALDLGHPHDVPARTEAVIKLDPWRETLVAQLMRALHQTGRTAEALGAYTSFAATLKADLDIEPPPDLRALNEQIASHDLMTRSSSIVDLTDRPLPGWFRAAIEELDREEDDPLLRGRLQLALGQAEQQAGLPGWEQTLSRAALTARSAQDPNLEARCLLAAAPGWSISAATTDNTRREDMSALLERDDMNLDMRARLLAAYATELTFDAPLEERIPLSDRAVEVARQSGNPATLLAVLNQRFSAIWAPETLDIRLEDTTQACQLAQQSGHPVAQAIAEGFAMAAAAEAADITAIDGHLTRFVALAERLRLPLFEWGAAVHTGWRAALGGDLDRAEVLAEQAWDIGRRAARPEANIVHTSQVAAIRWRQGRLAGQLPAIETLASHLPAFNALCASAHLQAGHAERAAHMLTEAWESGAIRSLRHDPLYLSALVHWADVAAATNQRVAAQGLYTMLAPFEHQLVFTGACEYGPVAQHLAALARMLEHRDAAKNHDRQAAKPARQLQHPVDTLTPATTTGIVER